MYQIVHGAAGLLIGSQTGNPWLAFILGLASHFILDAIPHDSIETKRWQDKGDYIKKIALEAMLDLLLFLLLMYGLIFFDKLNINMSVIAGIFGALLPDYIWGIAELFKIRCTLIEKYKTFHMGAHRIFHKTIYLPWYLVVPIQLGSLVMIILLYLRL